MEDSKDKKNKKDKHNKAKRYKRFDNLCISFPFTNINSLALRFNIILYYILIPFYNHTFPIQAPFLFHVWGKVCLRKGMKRNKI